MKAPPGATDRHPRWRTEVERRSLPEPHLILHTHQQMGRGAFGSAGKPGGRGGGGAPLACCSSRKTNRPDAEADMDNRAQAVNSMTISLSSMSKTTAGGVSPASTPVSSPTTSYSTSPRTPDGGLAHLRTAAGRPSPRSRREGLKLPQIPSELCLGPSVAALDMVGAPRPASRRASRGGLLRSSLAMVPEGIDGW